MCTLSSAQACKLPAGLQVMVRGLSPDAGAVMFLGIPPLRYLFFWLKKFVCLSFNRLPERKMLQTKFCAGLHFACEVASGATFWAAFCLRGLPAGLQFFMRCLGVDVTFISTLQFPWGSIHCGRG
jgi:hypothetical protein